MRGKIDVIFHSVNQVMLRWWKCDKFIGGVQPPKFGGCSTSGFDVIEGGSRRPSLVARCKKKTWYDRVNRPYNGLSVQWLIVTRQRI